MFSPETLFPVLRDIAEILSACGIRFHVTGGLLAVHYAEPRFTQDIDLVIDRGQLQASLERFLESLVEHGYLISAPAIRDSARSGRMFQALHSAECLKVDLYPRELIPGQFDRAIMVEVTSGLVLPFASLADLVASKLVWISKGSHKSRRDVRQLMLRATDQEQQLSRQFAEQLKLSLLLDEVLSEPDEIDA